MYYSLVFILMLLVFLSNLWHKNSLRDEYSSILSYLIIALHSTLLCPRSSFKLRSLRMGSLTSSVLTLSTGAPQACVLSLLLYALYMHDCVATHVSNTILKFVDDTTILGLITKNDETAYREEVRDLEMWCQGNNLALNVCKTKEAVQFFPKNCNQLGGVGC